MVAGRECFVLGKSPLFLNFSNKLEHRSSISKTEYSSINIEEISTIEAQQHRID